VAPQTATLEASSASKGTRSSRKGALASGLKSVKVTAKKARLYEKSHVTAKLTAKGSRMDGVLVHFYDDDPNRGGTAFDQEYVTRIRDKDSYVTKVEYQPLSCGPRQITVVVAPGSGLEKRASTWVDVGIDSVASVSALTSYVRGSSVNGAAKLTLLRQLSLAKAAFARHLNWAGERQLQDFIITVQFERARKKITAEQAKAMIDHARLIIGCV